MKISVVVALMGPERARNEMLPYLQSMFIITIALLFFHIIVGLFLFSFISLSLQSNSCKIIFSCSKTPVHDH